MVQYSGGDVDVTAGTGFDTKNGRVIPLIRLTVTVDDGPDQGSAFVWLRPAEARAVGLDLIGGAHAAISDAAIRVMAKKHGLDGDSLIGVQREITEKALAPDDHHRDAAAAAAGHRHQGLRGRRRRAVALQPLPWTGDLLEPAGPDAGAGRQPVQPPVHASRGVRGVSQHALLAQEQLATIERIRERIERAMHRESERDIDVAHDRLDLRLRAAVSLILDEELDQRRDWLRQAKEIDDRQAREQAEARR